MTTRNISVKYDQSQDRFSWSEGLGGWKEVETIEHKSDDPVTFNFEAYSGSDGIKYTRTTGTVGSLPLTMVVSPGSEESVTFSTASFRRADASTPERAGKVYVGRVTIKPCRRADGPELLVEKVIRTGAAMLGFDLAPPDETDVCPGDRVPPRRDDP